MADSAASAASGAALPLRLDGAPEDISGPVCATGPVPEQDLMKSLEALAQTGDEALLPQHLHQIAEAFVLKENFQWALWCLQLERLYHQRLLDNLQVLQEHWGNTYLVLNGFSNDHDNLLVVNCLCLCVFQRVGANRLLLSWQRNIWTVLSTSARHTAGESAKLCVIIIIDDIFCDIYRDKVVKMTEVSCADALPLSQTAQQQYWTPSDTRWPLLINTSTVSVLPVMISPVSGLVSILKRRTEAVDRESAPVITVTRSSIASTKRRVRFKFPDDSYEQDVGGGDSCLLLFLLCLVTVVISLGGTALYCALGDVHSSVCQDFSRNADFYMNQIQRGISHIQHWFGPGS
uniref:Uncharacterized protein n=1 Tax=Tetraodon nigroviridis TaxID=99883 RepID=H3DK05_TETNG